MACGDSRAAPADAPRCGQFATIRAMIKWVGLWVLMGAAAIGLLWWAGRNAPLVDDDDEL